MKKPIILAIVTVCLISLSVIFYYKKIDFSNGDLDFVSQKEVSENTETKGKNSWLSFFRKDNKDPLEVNESDVNVISRKDLSICNENGNIMVLMYHKFAEKSNDAWTRSLSDFKKDLETLYEKNYYPINMNDYIEGNIDVPYGKTPVILTFDDGTAGQLSFEWVDGKFLIKEDTAVKIYQDFVKEYPDFPMKGIFYIMSTNFFGAKGTFRQRLENLVSLGFEIGNQTKNHYPLQKATSAEKVIEEVGGLAKFVDEQIPGYKISSFSIPGGTMTKKYANEVYAGEYKGFSYENKGIVLLYSSKPALSPINKEIDLKKIPRIRVAGNEKISKDFEYWINYFDEHPEERYISDGDKNTFVIDAKDKDKVIEDERIVTK